MSGHRGLEGRVGGLELGLVGQEVGRRQKHGSSSWEGKGVRTGPEGQRDSAFSTSEDAEVTLLATWSSVLPRLGGHSPPGTRS